MTVQEKPATAMDFAAIKSKQQATWSSGDYALIGNTLQIVGETLAEAVDLRATHRVLDVAAGSGNATMAAARRFAEVVSTDYVGRLLENGRARAKANGFNVTFREADAEALPFDDAHFDIVLSTYGVMFTPDQEKAASEMLRVCKPGGRIGLANWTPEGFIGQLFKVIGKYVAPPPGLKSPLLWGTPQHLEALFGKKAAVKATKQNFVFRYRSPAHWVEMFRAYYGPVHKAFAGLDAGGQAGLEADILALLQRINTARDGSFVAPGEYLEVVATRQA
ncbi:MAG TPA: methyltransferase domain-containing protein [Reyranella sp.]|jgi:ubiquinone/menaquinone biosynthesis C-methylase UbiE|nr:methyltransferase domain-containing protein [Reyranella sp.]